MGISLDEGRMNEIERAINALELMLSCVNIYNDQREINAIKTSIKLCHAELKRQANEPMTCEGCKNLDEMFVDDSLCPECRRYEPLPDRYEPKGDAT
jgi:hypothetical protein